VNRRDLLQRYFPAPLVATALLLVLLILLTPVLVPNGQPAPGTIFTQAELTVDATGSSNLTSFYLHSPESNVRYAQIEVAVAVGFNWSGGFPSAPLTWTPLVNASDLVAYQFNSTANPIALNISLFYSTAGGQAYYVGVFAFYIGYAAGFSSLTLFTVSSTPGTSLTPGLNHVPVAELPGLGTIQLSDVGARP
jgi:hypothetical protein